MPENDIASLKQAVNTLHSALLSLTMAVLAERNKNLPDSIKHVNDVLEMSKQLTALQAKF